MEEEGEREKQSPRERESPCARERDRESMSNNSQMVGSYAQQFDAEKIVYKPIVTKAHKPVNQTRIF